MLNSQSNDSENSNLHFLKLSDVFESWHLEPDKWCNFTNWFERILNTICTNYDEKMPSCIDVMDQN